MLMAKAHDNTDASDSRPSYTPGRAERASPKRSAPASAAARSRVASSFNVEACASRLAALCAEFNRLDSADSKERAAAKAAAGTEKAVTVPTVSAATRRSWELQAAMRACETEQDALESLMAALPATSLRAAASQIALAITDVESLDGGSERQKGRVMRLMESALSAVLAAGGLKRDPFIRNYAGDDVFLMARGVAT